MKKSLKFDNKKRLILMTFIMMLTIGIINNIRGQIGPLIINDFDLNYSRLGFIFSFLSIGSMFTSFFIGKLVEKFGFINLITYGIIHNFISIILIYLANSYYTLLLAFLMLGIGIPIITVSALNIISISFSDKKGKMINFMQGFYGLGGVLAPYIVSVVVKADLRWAYSYFFILFLYLIILFLFKITSVPEMEIKEKKEISKTSELLTNKKVILFSLIYFIQVGVEFGVITWMAPYLKDVLLKSEIVVSIYISSFFILFTLGRLAASFIIEKIGYFNFLMLTSGCTTLLITLTLLNGTKLSFLLSLTGIFISVQIPTLQALILDSFDQNGVKVLGFAQTAGMLGATILSNWVIGAVNDILSIESGFWFLIIILSIVIILIYYLKNIIYQNSSA